MTIFVKIVACKLQKKKSPFLAFAKILLFLSYCGAFEERSCLSGPPLKLIIMRKDLGNFYVRTCVKFMFANN